MRSMRLVKPGSPDGQCARATWTARAAAATAGLPRRGCSGAAGPAPQDGGWSQPAILVHCGFPLVTPPVYSKNWMRSLQTAGALGYLPQASAGAPSACGPVNALALARMAEGDRWALPTSFMILMGVSICPKSTMFHGSDSSAGVENFFATAS